ncbi:MAG: hypothetical protein ACRELC_10195 [Gemmatimonadota bacterium]
MLLTGYALFRVRMAREMRLEAGEEARLQERLGRFRWPPPGLPSPTRLTLAALGWGFLLVLVVTGAALLAAGEWDAILARPWATRTGRLLVLKGGLVLGLVAVHAALGTPPRAGRAYACGVLTLLVVLVSALLGR